MSRLKIDVNATRQSGVWRIHHFSCYNRLYTVEDSGRQWRDEDGVHVLVHADGGRVFELIHQDYDDSWSLRQPPGTLRPV